MSEKITTNVTAASVELLCISTNMELDYPDTLTDGAGVVWQKIEQNKRGAIYGLSGPMTPGHQNSGKR